MTESFENDTNMSSAANAPMQEAGTVAGSDAEQIESGDALNTSSVEVEGMANHAPEISPDSDMESEHELELSIAKSGEAVDAATQEALNGLDATEAKTIFTATREKWDRYAQALAFATALSLAPTPPAYAGETAPDQPQVESEAETDSTSVPEVIGRKIFDAVQEKVKTDPFGAAGMAAHLIPKVGTLAGRTLDTASEIHQNGVYDENTYKDTRGVNMNIPPLVLDAVAAKVPVLGIPAAIIRMAQGKGSPLDVLSSIAMSTPGGVFPGLVLSGIETAGRAYYDIRIAQGDVYTEIQKTDPEVGFAQTYYDFTTPEEAKAAGLVMIQDNGKVRYADPADYAHRGYVSRTIGTGEGAQTIMVPGEQTE